MLALLYDVHGNLPALEAVLADASAQGADEYFIGGDVALFGAWPAETVERLKQLEPATWIRGNGERWTDDPSSAPVGVRPATAAAQEALGDALVGELGVLPQSSLLRAGTRAWHASPVSDVRSFAPAPADDEAELLAGVNDTRLIFGHTHLAFRRSSPVAGIELVNPGSVGIPFDGDARAAYALIALDGTIEQRRVAYDHHASAAALRKRYGDAPWVDTQVYRLTHARLEAG